MSDLPLVLRAHPELAIFLTIALGNILGRVRLGRFTVGAVTGVLVVGVAIGQLQIRIAQEVQTVFFLLFLFSIGYRVGPQFFSGLTKQGLPQLVLTTLQCATGLILTVGLAWFFELDAGTAGGLMAGALTESAAVGTSSDAIRRLGLPEAETQRLIGNVASAFAVAYLVGVIGVTWFLSTIAPRLMKVDLAAECRELEYAMGAPAASAPNIVSARRAYELRAFLLAQGLNGLSVSEIEASFGRRAFIERIRRGTDLLPAQPATVLLSGDIVAVAASRATLMEAPPYFGDEVEDDALLDVPATVLDVIVTNRVIAGRTLDALAQRTETRGVFLRTITRAGHELPLTPATIIERGDVLTLVGLESDVDQAIAIFGYADRPTSSTDMIAVGTSIFLGGLVGLPSLQIGGLEIGLGVSVGVLLGGLIAGWLRATRRTFAAVPEGALWIFDSVGLTAFIAVVGISSGPRFFASLEEAGGLIVVSALIIVLLPQLITILVGRFAMKLHPGILLGICAGAGTSGPALAAVQEKAQSKIPTLGYGVPYAVGNVLLAFWGTVVVSVLG